MVFFSFSVSLFFFFFGHAESGAGWRNERKGKRKRRKKNIQKEVEPEPKEEEEEEENGEENGEKDGDGGDESENVAAMTKEARFFSVFFYFSLPTKKTRRRRAAIENATPVEKKENSTSVGERKRKATANR